MSAIFLKVINMSISASWVILAVLIVRCLLTKTPKFVRVLLWGFVAFRLICPISINSVLSLIPSRETVSPEIMMDVTPSISTGIDPVDAVINPIITNSFAPQPGDSMNPLQLLIPLASILWILGVAAMLGYAAVSYVHLRKKIITAVRLRNNIYQSENVDAPFVLGIFKPKIYLPFRFDDHCQVHVIAHEEAHISRKDHWWKPLGFLLLALHWFNPLVWLSYFLLSRDIELACDEKVISQLDNGSRAAYAQALVSCSLNRRYGIMCPLAFGEVGVIGRVKSIMNYRKPSFWIAVISVLACAGIGVCFLTDPIDRVNFRKLHYEEANMPVILRNISDMTVTHEGISAECTDQADINRFLATMEKIYVTRKPISLSRSEERSKAFTITINGNTDLHFNDGFTEFWVDDHVKPSLTHGIKNPETAQELLLDFNFTGNESDFLSSSEETSAKKQLPLVILSNGEQVEPYLHFVYSCVWTGEELLCGDAAPLEWVIEELGAEGVIPQVEYTQDFDVILGENVKITEILLFDGAFNQLESMQSIGDLYGLDAGVYYVGISVHQDGRFIEEVNRNVYCGYDCAVQLRVN